MAENNLADNLGLHMTDLREDQLALYRSSQYILQGTMITDCQRRCLSKSFHTSSKVNKEEETCLYKCID